MTNTQNVPVGTDMSMLALGPAMQYCEQRQGMWTRAMAAGLDAHDVDGETLVLWAEEALVWEQRAAVVEAVLDGALAARMAEL